MPLFQNKVAMYWNSNKANGFFHWSGCYQVCSLQTQAPFLIIVAPLHSGLVTPQSHYAKLDNHHLHFTSTQCTQS